MDMTSFERYSRSEPTNWAGRPPRVAEESTPRVVLDRGAVRGCAVVRLAGELDLDVVSVLHRALVSTASATEPHVVVDLGLVDFMDCSALSAFERAALEARNTGGCLRLVGAHRTAARLLQAFELDRMFCVCASIDAATGVDLRGSASRQSS